MDDTQILNRLSRSSLGVPRKSMPQIESKDVPEFLRYLAGYGVSNMRRKVPAHRIMHTQSELNIDKGRYLMDQPEQLKKPILVSSDMYALDGHHRHLAAYLKNPKLPINVILINADIQELLEYARNFPKTFYKTIKENSSLIAESFSEFLGEVDE